MKKLLLKLLPFALACCLFAIVTGSSAGAEHSATQGNDVEDIVISGVKVVYTGESERSSDNGNSANRTYEYSVKITPGNNQSVVVDFIKAAGSNCTISNRAYTSYDRAAIKAAQSLHYTAPLNHSKASIMVFVYPDIDADASRFDTYVFRIWFYDPNELSGFGSDVGSIEVIGADVQWVTLSTAASNNDNANNVTYNYTIVLSGDTADDADVIVDFTKADGSVCTISNTPPISRFPDRSVPVILRNQSLAYTTDLISGFGSIIVYVYPDLSSNMNRYDTYVFNFTTGELTNPVSFDGLTLRIDDPPYPFFNPEPYMSFDSYSVGTYDVEYCGPQADYYPNALCLYVTSGASKIQSIKTSGNVSILMVEKTADSVKFTNNVKSGTYFIYPGNGIGSSGGYSGTVTFKLEASSGYSRYPEEVVLRFRVPPQIPTGSPDEVYAYVPAPGQFTNEGAGTGGWGDAFVSGSTGVKHMVGNVVSTGVSLGYFGGYAVFDMGENIANTATNPYGVDFVVYGNAFAGNSEPGCIQVARDANNDGKPDAWFNIAGSLHYSDNTIWNASYTYTNPTPADDVTTSYPTSGTINLSGVPYTYSHTARPGATAVTGTGTLTYNTFHQHSWFPLYANYFIGRGNVAALDKTGVLSFASYNRDTTNGSTLTLTGVMLGDAQNTQTAAYTFGYADVHPNGSANGVAANPYTASQSTTGGDGIDISWAVNANGNPVNLPDIRFVRVYTGAAKTNGIFGEISTEVCGVIKATGTGSGASNNTLTVKTGLSTISGIANLGTKVISGNAGTTKTYKITSNADHVFVNGTEVTSPYNHSVTFTAGTTQYCQIITQSGDRSPFVTLIKFLAN